MNLLILSNTTSKEEFKQSLKLINEINEKGLMEIFIQTVDDMYFSGTDLASCIHHAWYDLLIDPETGKFKQEIQTTEI